MKKLTLFLLFYCILGLFFQSCVKCPDLEITGTSQFYASGFPENFRLSTTSEIDTIVGPFFLSQEYATENVAFSTHASIGINTAYAWSCQSIVVNPIVETSFNLTFDRDFEFLGNTYLANTNLLDSPGLTDNIEFRNFSIDSPSADITFDQTFADEAVIAPGILTIRLTSETEDEVFIDSEITIFIDL